MPLQLPLGSGADAGDQPHAADRRGGCGSARGDGRLPLRTLATADLCGAALQLSQEHGISVHDACYLALALRPGATLLTADGKLQTAARRV